MMVAIDRQAGWESYWKLESVQPAYPANGRLATLLQRHWAAHLPRILPGAAGRVLEVAAGSGIVSAHIASLAGPNLQLMASDLAFGAASHAKRQHKIEAVNCDAQRLPFVSGSMDAVCSQFGLEYAGNAGLVEAARVIAPQGHLALILHWRDGQLYRENNASRDAARAFLDASLLPRFAELVALSSDPKLASAATAAFVTAVKTVETVLHGFGQMVAGGSLLHVYREVATMHGNMNRYNPEDIGAWCLNTANAIEAYLLRMQWMLDAAYSQTQLESATACLAEMGLQLVTSEPIIDPEQPAAPVAWWLCARREAN